MLDELDKIVRIRGIPRPRCWKPDPQQNNSFTDHYLDQPSIYLKRFLGRPIMSLCRRH
jgi:ATP-dependent Lon protease